MAKLTYEETQFCKTLIHRLNYHDILFTRNDGIDGYIIPHYRFGILELLKIYCKENHISYSYDQCVFELMENKKHCIMFSEVCSDTVYESFGRKRVGKSKYEKYYMSETEMMMFNGDVIGNCDRIL